MVSKKTLSTVSGVDTLCGMTRKIREMRRRRGLTGYHFISSSPQNKNF
jgi:hypothetical protein